MARDAYNMEDVKQMFDKQMNFKVRWKKKSFDLCLKEIF